MAQATQNGHPSSATDTGFCRDYIGHLQSDARLLLRFVTRQVDRALPKAALPGVSFDVLFAPPETILANSERLARLLACVDELSHRAAPANVRSIRLTAAYLRIPSRMASRRPASPGRCARSADPSTSLRSSLCCCCRCRLVCSRI